MTTTAELRAVWQLMEAAPKEPVRSILPHDGIAWVAGYGPELALLVWHHNAPVADKSGLSVPTIQRMEKLGVGRSSADNASKVQRTMETAGVEFIAENGGGAGVRLRQLTAVDRPQ